MRSRRPPLPSDPTRRALALVEASRPNPARPRLSDPELEAKLSQAESDRALLFAQREDLCDRLERVSEMIEQSGDGTISVEIDEETSAVHHAIDLGSAATRRIDDKGG